MNEPSLDKMRDRISKIPCPSCRKFGFLVQKTDRKSFAEDFLNGRCVNCSYHFPLSIPTRPLEQVDPDTALWLKALPCPSCEKRGAELNFRVTFSVRQCVHFLSCKHCNNPFHEDAPMEAYE